jgi:hypothetical protein
MMLAHTRACHECAVRLLPDPGPGVDPASFQDYKPGGACNGTRRARHSGDCAA